MSNSIESVTSGESDEVSGKGEAMNTILWKCEQYVAGKLHEKTIFESEEQAKDFARKLYGVRPDTILRIEPMPIQHVWN